MENHILNENELNEAYAEIKAVNEQIRSLENRKDEISQMLTRSAINKARSKFPGIGSGDKVRVVRNVYNWGNPKATETVIRYMGNYFLNRFAYGDYSNYDNRVLLELYLEKKDGTRSLRKDETRVSNIVSIEKVEE